VGARQATDRSEGRERRLEILYSSAEIEARIRDLAQDIAAVMGPDVMIVAILKGSFIFAADLVRALHHAGMRPRIDFMMLGSYGTATASSGRIEVLHDVRDEVQGREVLVVDDILESGRTVAFARERLMARGAARVRLCVLLDKPGKRGAGIEADFVGFRCPDQFVVGYGLDYAHHYRELPFIGYFADA